MKLSKPTYEALPVSYIIIGLGAMITVPSQVAFINGLVLSILGLLILFKRRNHRHIINQKAINTTIQIL